MTRDTLAGLRLLRLLDPRGRVRVGVVAGEEVSVLETGDILAALVADEQPPTVERIPLLDQATCAVDAPWKLLSPLVAPETWAAGVTYERSRDARQHESQRADVYELVYQADRPELFLKDAAGRRTVGPGEPILVRNDASWTVPEPELALVLGGDGDTLAATIGNDVSSRDIEGANPLYLPQAKIYAGACGLGPALLVPADWSQPFDIDVRIIDVAGKTVFEDQTSTDRMYRQPSELIEYLRRDNPIPRGTVLLTGTGIVPPDDVTLRPGQWVEITISGIGTLRNPVGIAKPENSQQEAAHV